MEKYRGLLEDGMIFIIMGVLAIMKELITKDGEIEWGKIVAKFFVNLIAGVGLYSFLLSYKEWYGEYPQKIGVIMFAVYTGSRVLDLIVDKVYTWLQGVDIRDIFNKTK